MDRTLDLSVPYYIRKSNGTEGGIESQNIGTTGTEMPRGVTETEGNGKLTKSVGDCSRNRKNNYLKKNYFFLYFYCCTYSCPSSSAFWPHIARNLGNLFDIHSFNMIVSCSSAFSSQLHDIYHLHSPLIVYSSFDLSLCILIFSVIFS